jgi:hypothetical protein
VVDEVVQPTSKSNVEYSGPWANAATTAEYLGVSEAELEAMREGHEILECTFADGQTYYPVRQFSGGKLVPGLREVLDVLFTGVSSEQVAATWLAGPADDGTRRTVWEQLADGDVKSVLAVARQDASRWSQ